MTNRGAACQLVRLCTSIPRSKLTDTLRCWNEALTSVLQNPETLQANPFVLGFSNDATQGTREHYDLFREIHLQGCEMRACIWFSIYSSCID